MEPQKYWLLVQANPRKNSGSAWMFAVQASDEEEAEEKVNGWAEKNHHHFAILTTLGNPIDQGYARTIREADKRKAVILLERRGWSVVKS